MAIEASKTGFSPLKVGCPVCESLPYAPCKEDGKLIIHRAPQFHTERNALWNETDRQMKAEAAAKLAAEETAKNPQPEPVHESVPPTNPANEKPTP